MQKKRFFWFKHDRHNKYLLQEIEQVLIADPVYVESMPVFAWFEIFDVINTARFAWWLPYDYWQRIFGSRLSIDFLATNIRTDGGGSQIKFPFYDSLYYVPSVRIRFEYAKPIDLRKQLYVNTFYEMEWGENTHVHKINNDLCFGYGIIDFLLLEGVLSTNYSYMITQDTIYSSTLAIAPEAVFSYYMEDFIKISLRNGCYIDITDIGVPDRTHYVSVDPFIGFDINWRIF